MIQDDNHMTTQQYESHSQASGQGSGFGGQQHASGQVSQEQRKHMIAEAAYYIAEHRHFQGGDPTRDWLQAEREIERRAKPAYR